MTLEATLVWREDGKDHEIPAAEFFLGPMVTSLPLAACLAVIGAAIELALTSPWLLLAVGLLVAALLDELQRRGGTEPA